jgi:predicted O-methyltransferase YrrM
MDEKLLAKICAIEGQISSAEIQFLHELAQRVPAGGVAVEVGSFRGRSAASIASGLPEGCHLVCIDPWTLKKEVGRKYATAETILEFQKNTLPWRAVITQIVGYPDQVSAWFNRKVDFFFSDSLKRDVGVNMVWDSWLKHCKSGTTIVTHDYQPEPNRDWHYPAVIELVEKKLKPITERHKTVMLTWSGVLK